MKKTSIMHLFTAAKNASPFDVNMAFDAGYEKIISYTDVTLNEIVALTQDAIFSRSPSCARNAKTGTQCNVQAL
jgi:methylene-tetrahydromethanopterin dehydrogenase